MTDYVKSTNFTSKDALASGNPLKIVKGTEFDIEFNNIAVAVATKADIINPALSGVPTAPTATAGNNTTQLATTAFVTSADTVAVTSAVSQAATAAAAAYPTKAGSGATGTWGINISGNAATATNATNATNASTAPAGNNSTLIGNTAFIASAISTAIAAVKETLYPVGSIYTNSSNGTNPASLLGFGSWAAFGAGRVLIGLNPSNGLFDSPEETGGSYDATLVSHSHTGSTGGQSATHSHSASTSISDPGHRHRIAGGVGGGVAVLGTQTGTVAGIGAGTSGGYEDTYNGVPIIENKTTGISASTSIGNASGDHSHSFTTDANGSGASNANIQPYITVYMWKRTA